MGFRVFVREPLFTPNGFSYEVHGAKSLGDAAPMNENPRLYKALSDMDPSSTLYSALNTVFPSGFRGSGRSDALFLSE